MQPPRLTAVRNHHVGPPLDPPCDCRAQIIGGVFTVITLMESVLHHIGAAVSKKQM